MTIPTLYTGRMCQVSTYPPPAVIACLGVEVAPTLDGNPTADTCSSAPMTLAFTNTDNYFADKDFCAAALSKDQLHAKIQHHVKFLNYVSDSELQAVLGEEI